MTCPVCTCETETPHDEEQCAAALIESGLFAQAPWWKRTVPPPDKWTDREREFANELAQQAIRWKRAELDAIA